MTEMIVLKALYMAKKKDASTIASITGEALGLDAGQFLSALRSLQEHGYITDIDLTKSEVTKKGCLLAKELL